MRKRSRTTQSVEQNQRTQIGKKENIKSQGRSAGRVDLPYDIMSDGPKGSLHEKRNFPFTDLREALECSKCDREREIPRDEKEQILHLARVSAGQNRLLQLKLQWFGHRCQR